MHVSKYLMWHFFFAFTEFTGSDLNRALASSSDWNFLGESRADKVLFGFGAYSFRSDLFVIIGGICVFVFWLERHTSKFSCFIMTFLVLHA